jgi:hypothetical protein
LPTLAHTRQRSEGKRWRKKYVSLNLVCSYWANLGGDREIGDARAHDDLWTTVLGIIGSVIGGSVTDMFRAPQTNAIIPPASFYPHGARSWFFLFAIS